MYLYENTIELYVHSKTFCYTIHFIRARTIKPTKNLSDDLHIVDKKDRCTTLPFDHSPFFQFILILKYSKTPRQENRYSLKLEKEP